MHGILEPLVISADRFIISGHRRHMAAGIAGLKHVPCRTIAIRRGNGEKADDVFVKLLREHNRHRIKSRNELLREAITDVDPNDAHRALTAYRVKKGMIDAAVPIEVREATGRCGISAAKMEFLHAIQKIIAENRKFLPLSLRQIHYLLLNEPPLIHSRKHTLLTRARHEGYVAYEAIDDPTRPTTTWKVFQVPCATLAHLSRIALPAARRSSSTRETSAHTANTVAR